MTKNSFVVEVVFNGELVDLQFVMILSAKQIKSGVSCTTEAL